MTRFIKYLACVLPLSFFASCCLAKNEDGDSLSYLFPSKTVYFGVNIGGGYTTWKYLVDTRDAPPDPIDPSTPIAVNEGGPSWGVVAGFDVAKNFAIELQYMQFADSHISFDQNGYDTYGYYSIVSKTDAYSLSGKFFVPVGNRTHLRAFAAVGVGTVERNDVINKASCVTPYLSSGLDYNFTRHWIVEGGFQYYTGFGASELNPVNDFIPFAWDGYARLAYQL
jgi:hypothetical protein